MTDLDVDAELARLKAQSQSIRKKRFRKSRLDRYHGELLSLHRAGAKPAELQRWLRSKRVKVVLSTVIRWLENNG